MFAAPRRGPSPRVRVASVPKEAEGYASALRRSSSRRPSPARGDTPRARSSTPQRHPAKPAAPLVPVTASEEAVRALGLCGRVPPPASGYAVDRRVHVEVGRYLQAVFSDPPTSELYGLGGRMAYTDVFDVMEVCGLGSQNTAASRDDLWFDLQTEQRVTSRSPDVAADSAPFGGDTRAYVTDAGTFERVLRRWGAAAAARRRIEVALLRAAQQRLELPASGQPHAASVPRRRSESPQPSHGERSSERVRGYVLLDSARAPTRAPSKDSTPSPVSSADRLGDRLPTASAPQPVHYGLPPMGRAAPPAVAGRVISAPRRHADPFGSPQSDARSGSPTLSNLTPSEGSDSPDEATPRSTAPTSTAEGHRIRSASPLGSRDRRRVIRGSDKGIAAAVASKRTAARASVFQRLSTNRKLSTGPADAYAHQKLQQREQVEAECTFAPHINAASHSLGTKGDVRARLFQPTASRAAKLEQEKEKEALELERQVAACTFAPALRSNPCPQPSDHVPPMYVEAVARLRQGISSRRQRPLRFEDDGYLRPARALRDIAAIDRRRRAASSEHAGDSDGGVFDTDASDVENKPILRLRTRDGKLHDFVLTRVDREEKTHLVHN